jgi:hypothetical protein
MTRIRKLLSSFSSFLFRGGQNLPKLVHVFESLLVPCLDFFNYAHHLARVFLLAPIDPYDVTLQLGPSPFIRGHPITRKVTDRVQIAKKMEAGVSGPEAMQVIILQGEKGFATGS